MANAISPVAISEALVGSGTAVLANAMSMVAPVEPSVPIRSTSSVPMFKLTSAALNPLIPENDSSDFPVKALVRSF